MGGSTRINKRRLKTFTDAVHLYNFETGLWFNAGKLSIKKETTGVMVGKKFYLVGGYNDNWLDIIESLDLFTGRWMSSAIKDPSAVSNEETIYIYERGKIHVFDTTIPEMKTYLIDLEVEGPDLHIYNNQLILIGGYYQHEYTRTPYDECFKIELKEFDKTEVLRRTTF